MSLYPDDNNKIKVIGESKGPKVKFTDKQPFKTYDDFKVGANPGSISMEVADGTIEPIIEVHTVYRKLSDKEKYHVLKKFHSWIGRELLKVTKNGKATG